jgi:hypothetical protein
VTSRSREMASERVSGERLIEIELIPGSKMRTLKRPRDDAVAEAGERAIGDYARRLVGVRCKGESRPKTPGRVGYAMLRLRGECESERENPEATGERRKEKRLFLAESSSGA